MLAEKPLNKKLINQWAGVLLGQNPHTIPDGAAQEQVNVECIAPGVMAPRSGHSPLTFANESTAELSTDGLVIAMTFFQQPNANFVIYHLYGGKVKYGRL
jgi:hypothetical protein